MLRRDFLQTAGTLVGGMFCTSLIPPYKIKLSCNFYSFNQVLTEKSMTLEEAVEFCAELGFDAIDPTGYYFDGYPAIPSDQYIYHIKNVAFRNGLAISGTGIRTDFSLPDVQQRKGQVELTKRWVEVAAKLDAPVLRVFAGQKVPEGYSIKQVKPWIIDALAECIEFGQNHGVIITLQNHFDVLRSVDEIKSVLDHFPTPWFGLNLDIGSLRLGNPYEDIQILLPYARTWQIKEHVYRNNQKEETDISKLMQIIKQGGYRGYLPLETLPPADVRVQLRPFFERVKNALES